MSKLYNIIRPKPQSTFREYQLTCPFSIKSRCGRRFCTHELNKKNTKCVRYNCLFYKEDSKLLRRKIK